MCYDSDTAAVRGSGSKLCKKSERVKRVPSRKGGTGSMLVEAARIELASENSSIQLSTSVFYLLRFP